MRHIRKREVVILLTMSIVLVILGNAFSVFAATSSELKNKQQNNQKQILCTIRMIILKEFYYGTEKILELV